MCLCICSWFSSHSWPSFRWRGFPAAGSVGLFSPWGSLFLGSWRQHICENGWFWGGSIRGAGIRTNSLGFPWAVYSNLLEKYSKALFSCPFTFYHYLHFLCSRHWRKPFIYLRHPPSQSSLLRGLYSFPLFTTLLIGSWEGNQEKENVPNNAM